MKREQLLRAFELGLSSLIVDGVKRYATRVFKQYRSVMKATVIESNSWVNSLKYG